MASAAVAEAQQSEQAVISALQDDEHTFANRAMASTTTQMLEALGTFRDALRNELDASRKQTASRQAELRSASEALQQRERQLSQSEKLIDGSLRALSEAESNAEQATADDLAPSRGSTHR